jgi:RNA polymerase sigma-70 factor (ECF subfamily)
MTTDTHPEAHDELVRHAGFLRALASTLTMPVDTPDDIVHDVLLAAMAQRPDPDRGLGAWLVGTLRRTVWKSVRSRTRRSARERAAARSEIAGSPDVADLEMLGLLTRAVLRLEEPYRATITALYYRGQTAEDFAAEAGVPAATIRTRHRRALESLRATLDRKFGGDSGSWLMLLNPLLSVRHSSVQAAAASGTASSIGPVSGSAVRIAGNLIMTKKMSGLLACVLVAICIGIVSYVGAGDIADEIAASNSFGGNVITSAPESEPRRSAPVAQRSPETANSGESSNRSEIPKGRLKVTVHWLTNDRPAASIGVWTMIEAGDYAVDCLTGTTDERGEYVFTLDRPGRYSIGADGGTEIAQQFDVELGRETNAVILLSGPGKIAGIVVDPSDRPVAGASIFITRRHFDDVGSIVARSGADGRFELEEPLGGERKIAAFSPTHGASDACPVESTIDATRPIKLIVREGAGTLIGRVIGEDGSPVRGAVVRVDANPGSKYAGFHRPDGTLVHRPPERRVRTDDDGRFTAIGLSSRQGLTHGIVVVHAHGYAAGVRPFEWKIGETTEIDILLEPAASLSGVVADELGRPLTNVDLRLEPTDDLVRRINEFSRYFAIDEEAPGEFRFDGILPGPYEMTFTSKGYRPHRGIVQLAPGKTETVRVTLAKAPIVFGRIVDKNENGLKGLRISAKGGGLTADYGDVAETSDDGSFEFGTDADGPLTLAVREPPEVGDPILIPERVLPGVPVHFCLTPAMREGVRFEGSVTTDQGLPVADAEIIIRRKGDPGAPIDRVDPPTGAFRSRRRLPGEYDIELRSPTFGEKYLGTITGQFGRPTSIGKIELATPAVASIRIVAKNPKDLEGRYVVLEPSGGMRRHHPLEPAILRRVVAQPGPLLVEIGGEGRSVVRRTVSLESGKTTEIAIDLDVER